METNVLIVGAGPVGLSLALELSNHGVACTIVEKLAKGAITTVRCNHVSSRTMEFFRRCGFSDSVRRSGLPETYQQDVSYRVSTTGKELSRIKIAAWGDRFTARDTGVDSKWPTPEPPHRMNQLYLEPLMVRAAEERPEITLLFEHELVDFAQSKDGVSATVRTNSGEILKVGAGYLAGCDGGSSPIRAAIGAKLEGDAVIQRVQSTYLRAAGLIEQMETDPCWCMFSLNPDRVGNVYSIDGKELWLVHNYLRDEEPEFDSVDRDQCIRSILGVGPEFQYEALNIEDWYGRRLVADKMRDRRVFLAGDAAHLWVPYAGYGMNAGIADAINLGWLLAGVVNGWAGDAILDAYEAERRPITAQVSKFAMDHCIKMAAQRSAVPKNIDEASPEGEASRRQMGKETYDLNVQQYCAAGLNYGYYYDGSPVILYDGENAPAYSMSDYQPSSVPGCRVPHFWTSEGTSLYDELGVGFTLIRTNPDENVAQFITAAAALGMPLKLVDISPPPEVAVHYTRPLMLVRPDQHVAWRGSATEDDALMVLANVCGR